MRRVPTHVFPKALVLYLLAVIGLAACGGDGDDGGGTAQDTTAPSVALLPVPLELGRTAELAAEASDNVGVVEVEFFVDDASIGTATSAPFTVEWDTTTTDDGQHSVYAVASDAAGNSTTSETLAVTVSNVRDFTVSLSPDQVFPVPDSDAAAEGSFTVNLVTGETSGSITATGFTPTAAHIHDGYAGVNGPVVLGLEQDATDPSLWRVPDGGTLESAALDRLLDGALYINVHSADYPGGEVRAQLLPAGYRVLLVGLSGVEEVPEVITTAGGRGAVTVDTATGRVAIHVNTTAPGGSAAPLAGATGSHLHNGLAGTNGPVLVPLMQDGDAASHWFNNSGQLDEAGVDALMGASTYLNVHSEAYPGGEIRGQVVPDGYTVVVSRMNAEQQAPEPLIAAARGTAALTVAHDTGATEVRLNVTGADDATAAHIHSAYAGANGGVIIGLEKDAGDTTVWRSNGAMLTGPQMDLLADGGLYANVHTPDFPNGFIRGQLVPDDVELVISHLNGDQAGVATEATGRASTTVNLSSGRLTVNVNTQGVDDAMAAHLHTAPRGEAGPVSIPLQQDSQDSSRWFAEGVGLTGQQLADYTAGLLYANVHTPANPDGEIRGQIELGGVVPFLFADIQTGIFNATCATSGCHSGESAPFGLDLSAGVSHTNLVGVPSGQVPGLLRVAPGDAPASYLVRKLQGGPDIVGVQMPNGLPPLAQATIDRLQAWINAGALPAAETPSDDVAPTVTLGTVPGTITGTVTLTAEASDNVGVTLVRWRVDGSVVGSDATAPYSFDWDSTANPDGAVTIDAQALDEAGNVGTSASASATVSNPTGVEPFTFSEIQSQIFNVSCALSGCHTGGAPAAGMDLSASAYADIVNVPSTEQPSLDRIEPGDASQSYLVLKLEGDPSISGARMPFGGPYLSQATIDRIRAWVDSGAPND